MNTPSDEIPRPENFPQKELSTQLSRIGKWGRRICSSLLVLTATGGLALEYALIRNPAQALPHLKLSVGPFEFSKLNANMLSAPQLAGLAALVAGILALCAALLWLMRRVFIRCEQGELITHDSARLILWLGGIRLALALLDLSPMDLLNSLFLLSFGYAIHLATKLREEQDLTV